MKSNQFPRPWRVGRTPSWRGKDSYQVVDSAGEQVEYLYGVSKPFAAFIITRVNAEKPGIHLAREPFKKKFSRA